MTGLGRADLNAMIEEATIDCYDEEEQLTGLATMLEENLEVPFTTAVLGIAVTVTGVTHASHGLVPSTRLGVQTTANGLRPVGSFRYRAGLSGISRSRAAAFRADRSVQNIRRAVAADIPSSSRAGTPAPQAGCAAL